MRYILWGALLVFCAMGQIAHANGLKQTVYIDAGKYCGRWSFAGVSEVDYDCTTKSPNPGNHYGDCNVQLKKPSSNNRLWIAGSNFRVDVDSNGVIRTQGEGIVSNGSIISFNVMPYPISFLPNGINQAWGFEYDNICGNNLLTKYMVKGTTDLLTNVMAGTRVSVSADGRTVTTDKPEVFEVNGLTIEFKTVKIAIFPATVGPWELFKTVVFEAGQGGGTLKPGAPAWTTVLAEGELQLKEKISGKVVLFETKVGCRIEPPSITVGGRRFDFYTSAECKQP